MGSSSEATQSGSWASASRRGSSTGWLPTHGTTTGVTTDTSKSFVARIIWVSNLKSLLVFPRTTSEHDKSATGMGYLYSLSLLFSWIKGTVTSHDRFNLLYDLQMFWWGYSSIDWSQDRCMVIWMWNVRDIFDSAVYVVAFLLIIRLGHEKP